MRSILYLALVGFLHAALAMPESDFKSIRGRKLEDEVIDHQMHPRLPQIATRFKSAHSSEAEKSYWEEEASKSLRNQLNKKLNVNVAKNVIFFLGDGMSIPTLMAARTYQGQLTGKSGEEGELYWETFPFTGLSKTWCLDKQVADSACTSTAYMTGVKTQYGTLGINGHVIRGDCSTQRNESNHLTSILQWAMEYGKSSGFVTTTRVTHASPGGGYAHAADRDWESDTDVIRRKQNPNKCMDIAAQLVTQEPGRSFNVIMGGGRRGFLGKRTVDDEGTMGVRTDGRNLIEEWKRDKASRGRSHFYSWNRTSVLDMISHPERYEYVLGLYEASHCPYHLEASPETEPTLAEMTEAAIKVLRRNDMGFVLFVEGGRIDHAHHAAWAKLALDETVELAKAVKKGRELTSSDDTLVIVTADHAHTMTVAGYSDRGNPIAGKSTDLGSDKLGYMTLSYANGPGYMTTSNGDRHNIDNDDVENLKYRYAATVPLRSETHGGDDVAIFASGPWSHLFTGTIEQSNIPHFLAYASCIRQGSACDSYH
ncbi:membrane-bound alkaline phosphatase [Diachasma alloeum]|uniref:membrane-bound alkaline phosphatase n=1 Tax=Diachasma alloeum TaxID=454923 RepID=UPI000738283E|nr:membrane-bound alkaline phosphatase [Diachasma alloeum]